MEVVNCCPDWFWFILVAGMLMMVGMFFMCHKKMGSGMMDMCGCGGDMNKCKPKQMKDCDESSPSEKPSDKPNDK